MARPKPRLVRADTLKPGDRIRTAIGDALIVDIYESHGGVEAVIRAHGKKARTMAPGTRVVWWWRVQPVLLTIASPGKPNELKTRPLRGGAKARREAACRLTVAK